MRYILLIALLIILYSSNPGIETHQNAVKVKISNVIKQQVSFEKSKNNTEQASKLLLDLFGVGLADQSVKEFVKRKDYFFFSLTIFEFNGNETTIGVGLLGNVFISDEFEKELNNKINKIKSSFDNSKGSMDN